MINVLNTYKLLKILKVHESYRFLERLKIELSSQIIIRSKKFHILGPKYLMDLDPYDVVFILGRDSKSINKRSENFIYF